MRRDVPHDEPWMDHLDIDFAKPPEARVLVGFLKRGCDDPKLVRLYLTLDLDEYIEMREDDVLGSWTLETAQNPLGGTAVWVKRTAQLRWLSEQYSTEHGSADFIRGAIVSRYLRGSGLAGLHAWWREITIVGIKTPQVTIGCPVSSNCTPATNCDPCQLRRMDVDVDAK